MPDSVDAAAVRRWCAGGLAALRRHQAEIDALNVYPVPDGDTGTNLVLTMSSAVEAATGATAAEAMRGAARGALLGARGNSGIILAQLFKGLAAGLERAGAAPVTGEVLAGALDGAARGAYDAVAEPVEGTVLTVGVAAAEAAVAASARGGVVTVARAAAQGAREALARTPEQLPALARAGVVDAGGRGLVVLLDALVETLTGEEPPDGPVAAVAPVAGRPGAMVERETGSADFAYEVQYLLEAPADAVETLRGALAGLGDSLVIVGDEPTWHVHVHVNDVGAAIEAGIAAGRPSRIAVTRFEDQIASAHRSAGAPERGTSTVSRAGDEPEPGPRAGAAGGQEPGAGGQEPGEADEPQPEVARAAAARADAPVARPDRAVVVVCTGRGLARLLEAEGAIVLTGNPSTRQLLDAIVGAGAERVIVLPNDGNVLAVAAVAAEEARAAGVRAGVVPTRSPVQALAAMAVRDPARRFEDDVIAMAEAAARCRSAEVTVAGREALTVAGRCQPGDVLAIVDGEVNLIGRDLPQTACLLLDRMLAAGGELVTLIAGRDAPEGLGATLRAHVEGSWPFVEVQCYEGGQPHYPLLVGVE